MLLTCAPISELPSKLSTTDKTSPSYGPDIEFVGYPDVSKRLVKFS